MEIPSPVICLCVPVIQHMCWGCSHTIFLFLIQFQSRYIVSMNSSSRSHWCSLSWSSSSWESSVESYHTDVISVSHFTSTIPPVRTCCDAAQESEWSLRHNTCLDMQMGDLFVYWLYLFIKCEAFGRRSHPNHQELVWLCSSCCSNVKTTLTFNSCWVSI